MGAAIIYFIIWAAMAIGGALVLVVFGDYRWTVLGWTAFGSWLALPVALGIGIVLTVYWLPKLRGQR